MADPRFFPQAGPFTLARLAEVAQAQIGRGEPGQSFRGVATLDTAGPDDVSFLDNRRYIDAFIASRAGACLVRAEFAARAPAGMALLLTERPYHGYAGVARAFHPDPEIFGPKAHFIPERVFRMTRSKAYLFGGVEIRWSCDKEMLEGTEVPEKATFHFEEGLKDYLSETLKEATLITT